MKEKSNEYEPKGYDFLFDSESILSLISGEAVWRGPGAEVGERERESEEAPERDEAAVVERQLMGGVSVGRWEEEEQEEEQRISEI